MMILLYFSLKVADVPLSESGHLVPWWLTPHMVALGFGIGLSQIVVPDNSPVKDLVDL